MNIAVPKETAEHERRVALTPDVVKRLVADGHTVRVERSAGYASTFPDDEYTAVGATIVSRTEVWDADVILKIQPPTSEERARMKSGSVLVGMFYPMTNTDVAEDLATRGVTSFSLDALPRISRAQSMDILSSMSTVAGYKAVLMAAAAAEKFFPMLVTAAGTIVPSKVFVLGAGVAGLQAIATARRLGAVVSAFDVRPAVKEQVESLGAKFIAADQVSETAAGSGGYAKELSDEQHKRELQLIHETIRDMDAVITTALIPGKPAPELITEEMVRDMHPGAVIVDLAAEQGGNCTLTAPGKTVEHHGVTIIGPVNLPASMSAHASQMYAKNISTFLKNMTKDGELNIDFEDEITAGTCITKDGRIVHEGTRSAMNGGSAS